MNEKMMMWAIELAVENVRTGRGGPFACVIAKDDRVLASGTNQVAALHDPTAHAEILAIRAACAALGSFQLDGCDIYATCEPCPMCLGAIYWSRAARVFFGASARDAAEAGFDDAVIYRQIALAAAARSIPFIQAMREDALAAFREWSAKADRVDY